MITEQQYIIQTENIINFYSDKKAKLIREYISTCHNYITELRSLDAIELYTELEYEKAFNRILSLVDETYRPDHFDSIINGSKLRFFSDEFMIYILAIQKQIKKPLKWKILVELQYKFSMLEIHFKIRTSFREDFTLFAIKNISILELWETSI